MDSYSLEVSLEAESVAKKIVKEIFKIPGKFAPEADCEINVALRHTHFGIRHGIKKVMTLLVYPMGSYF